MKLSKQEQSRLIEIVSDRLRDVISGQIEKRAIASRVDEAPVIPSHRAAGMVGRINTKLVLDEVNNAVYDNVGLDLGDHVAMKTMQKLPKIIASVFRQYAVENEFGDTFNERDFGELESMFPELEDAEMELASNVANLISEFAKDVAKLALSLTGADSPTPDEDGR
jgi:hypothetical protein